MKANTIIQLLAIGLITIGLGACSEPPGPQQAEPADAGAVDMQAQAPDTTSAEPGDGGAVDMQAEAPVAAGAESGPGLPPLPIEPLGITETLPERYPDHWFLVHDAAFFSMSDGKVTVVDAAATTVNEQVKGNFNISLIGSVTEGLARNEIYATETFYSRGTRGERTDVLTVWNKASLEAVGEVILPPGKRFTGLPERHTLQLIDDEKFLLVFNMNPATSVTVIETAARRIVTEIAIPGCVKTFPTGQRGFSSLCADGRFMSTELNEDGTVLRQTRGDAFFDSDTSPIFQRTAIVDGVGYFPSFDGRIYPVDLSGPLARPGAPWHLAAEDERAENWRPGGLGIIDRDSIGHLYILMHPDGGEGSHQSGGAEVWVFDPASQQRISRIALREWGLSLALSRGDQPLMMVTNPTTMALEIYDAQSGDYLRTLDGLFQFTPLMLYGAR